MSLGKIVRKITIAKKYDTWYMLFGIRQHMSYMSKFWQTYMITYIMVADEHCLYLKMQICSLPTSLA